MPKRRRAPGEGSIYQRKKDGRWVASITIPGPPGAAQRRRTRYARTKTEASKKLDQMRAEIRDGYYTPSTLTIGEHMADYVAAHQAHWKAATLDMYERTIETHITPQLGKHRLRDLKPHHIRTTLETVEAVGGVSIAKTVRTLLNSACEWAIRMQVLGRNPVTPIRTTPVKSKERTIWTDEEAATALEHARGTDLYPLVYLMLSTGLRRGEALALTWGDLTVDAVTVRRTINLIGGELVANEPKSAKARRTVGIPADCAVVLTAHRNALEASLATLGGSVTDATPVFPDPLGGYQIPRGVLDRFKRLCREAGVRVVNLHSLRHWHASSLLRVADLVEVSAKLGHSNSIITLRTYAHAKDSARERTTRTLAELGVKTSE